MQEQRRGDGVEASHPCGSGGGSCLHAVRARGCGPGPAMCDIDTAGRLFLAAVHMRHASY